MILAAAACAVVQEPPGGPPDFTPPTIVSIVPDSGAVVPDLDDPVDVRFDEVISERGLENLVVLMPRTRRLEVDWKRTRIEVEPDEGWRPGVVYHLTVRPGVTDLRNNRLEEGRTVIFSTGDAIPDTRLSGTVVDWERGVIGRGAVVEAVLVPDSAGRDSLVYATVADSVGDFGFTALPRRTYAVVAAIDGNNNGQRDRGEPLDSTTITLDSLASHVFWTFTHDTTGPMLRTASVVDSVTVRLEFGQMLDTVPPADDAVSVWALPDTVAVGVEAVWTQAQWDSLRATRDTVADTTGVQPAADTAGAPAEADPAAADTVGARVPGRPAAQQPVRGELIAQRPALHAVLYVRLAAVLVPESRYLVEARVRNLLHAEAESRSLVLVPQRDEGP